MKRLLLMPALLALAVLFLTSACASKAPVAIPIAAVESAAPQQPYMAQVVGVQWLNPLQRRTDAEEVAQAALFLAQGALRSGETLFVDSGQHLLHQPRDVIYLSREQS